MKKVRIDLDMDRCVCCYACVIACQDQHYDIDEEGPALRRALRCEKENGAIECLSIGCMHCEDAPCLEACPTGSIYRDPETGLVQVDDSLCVGCQSCLEACPFGAPKFTADSRMVKCDGCMVRVKQGLLPVCVKTCPSHALLLCEEEDEVPANSLRKRILQKEIPPEIFL